jgi:RNA 3'-terminal phosphate cyclase (ATP)
VIFNQHLVLHHVRAKRENPGLGPQHLVAVNALAKVSRAKVEGNVIGSQKVIFIPGEISPGDYHFSIGTAGSVTLLLQALLLPLCLSGKRCRLILEGGTHVPWSPPLSLSLRNPVPDPALHGRLGHRKNRSMGLVSQRGWSH